MPEQLFDRAAEYDAMLQQGLRVSGEDKRFFMVHRVRHLQARLRPAPSRILDFGCGTGETSAHLAEIFPEATVVGLDSSESALRHSAERFGCARVKFAAIRELKAMEPFDLCYVNGVFHHVEPRERVQALTEVRQRMRPGSQLMFFENNPWNPGTRLVMSRIPFDRDAMVLSYLEARSIIRQAGFQVCSSTFLFFFPRLLASLRPIEQWLTKVPLGAQYCVAARVPL